MIRKRTPLQPSTELYEDNPFAPKTTYFPRTAGDIEANDKMEAAALAAGAFNESDLALNALQRDEALMREQQLDSVTFRTEG